MSDHHEEADLGITEFWTECEELVERLSSQLPLLEKGDYAPDVIDSVYRDIHTIKGSAQLFGLHQVGNIAHALETNLEPVRTEGHVIRPQLLEMLYQGVSVIDKMIRAYRDHESEAQADLIKDIPRLIEVSLESVGGNMSVPKDSSEVNEMVSAPVHSSSPSAAASPAPATVAATATTTDDHGGQDSSSTIRVPVGLLDKLMTLMGEMVLVRNQVLQYSSRSDDLSFLNLSQRLDVVTSEIQSEMMKTRMQPMGNILNKFQRLVRDLSKDLGKKMDLHLFGTETELDKTLLEAVKDPLTHIIRNACDHGMEMPAERKAAGKNETGKISVRAFHEGGQVIIEISDDGKGLHKETLLKKAIEKGLITKEKEATMSEREIFNIIFMPGFSTAAKVTNISGRGVGMDVVRSNIDKIGGIVELQSKYGQGTTIRLKIPLTLAIVPAMIISCNQDRYAIPQVKLVELLRVETASAENKIEMLQGKTVYRLRGNLLPLVYLKDFLGFPTADGEAKHQLPDVVNIVVLKAERQIFGLIVDEIQDTADIVVKPLNRFLKSLNVYSGATVLGDGSVALILDVLGIAQRMMLTSESESEDSKIEASKQLQYKNADVQEFLLFKVNSVGKHAIPLDLVHRLEEFKRSDLEFSGGTRVMRYRDSILPIISLNKFLDYDMDNKSSEKDVIPVIVSQKGGHYFGIEVNEILDVLVTESSLDESLADRPGILGSFISNGEVIVAVDSSRVLENVTKRNSKHQMDETKVAGTKLKSGMTVLYAEDNAFFRSRVSSILMKHGIKVQTAFNGADALAALENAPPHTFAAVLSDIEMPRMNGFELAVQIRKNNAFKDIPLIALTTQFSQKNVQKGMDSGFNLYLEKLNAEELIANLENITLKKAS